MGADVTKQLLLEEMVRISDLLYQNNLTAGMKELPGLIQKLAGFANNLKSEDVPGYTNILKNIMEAMELKDYILLADLLIYEISPLVQSY